MNYLPLPDEAARQVIDSQTIFTELQRVRAQAAPLSGGMYWKKEGGYEYLVKTSARNRQTRVGPRSPELEQVYAQFKERKAAVQTRLSSLEGLAAMERARQSGGNDERTRAVNIRNDPSISDVDWDLD
mgnify:CR=1 FL=1